MADDEIEWLDEPAMPTAAPHGTHDRRTRRRTSVPEFHDASPRLLRAL